jgi:hypothetical protein
MGTGKTVDRFSFCFFTPSTTSECISRTQAGFALLALVVRIVAAPPPPPPEIRGEDEPWGTGFGNPHSVCVQRPPTGARLPRSAATETPKGLHRIYWKQGRATFDRSRAQCLLSGACSFRHVFLGSYALHGAYWHDDFGANETHGCINLAPVDARWLFSFLLPALPPGYASIRSNARTPGSWVRLRR